MSVVEFSKEEKALITQKLQRYVATELGFEMGSFDAEFLLDFVSKELGCYFYNRGLYDAQTVVNARIEEMAEAIVVLEKFEPSN